MRQGTACSALAAALLMAGSLFGAPSIAQVASGDLLIHAHGFAHDRGQAVAHLYGEGDEVPAKPRARVTAQVRHGKAELVFRGIAAAPYAVIVYHDENGNGVLDHNLLGIPGEPIGFSNGFRLSLLSGMPTFQKLRVDFGAGTRALDVRVK